MKKVYVNPKKFIHQLQYGHVMPKLSKTNWDLSTKIFKKVFIDRHEQPDVIKDYNHFLKKIEKLKPYMIEFEKNTVNEEKCWLVIMIKVNEYIFSANDKVRQV